jgi:predicted RNA binding protein YcfA (HicA-like mRNA interferase family)
MSQWPASKSRRVLAALLRIGWNVKRHSGGSHRVLERAEWPDFVFAFHDEEEVGPRMMARIAKRTGLRPDDLRPGYGSLCSQCPIGVGTHPIVSPDKSGLINSSRSMGR